MSVFLSIIIMLLMLSVLTVVHEWGHFIFARMFKVKVVEFSIFMGPKLFSRTSKKTGTKFSLRLIPLGGYCSFEDDRGNANAPDSLYRQKWWKRAIIFCGGVFMNFVLALVLTVTIVGCGYFTSNTLETVDKDSIAYFAGIREGDRLVKLNGIGIRNGTDVNLATLGIEDTNPDEDVVETHYTLVYKRNGKKISYDVSKYYSLEREEIWQDGKKQDVRFVREYSYTIRRTENGNTTEYYYHSKINLFDDENGIAYCTVTKTVDGEPVAEGTGGVAVKYENVNTLANDGYKAVKTRNPFVLIYRAFFEMLSMIKSVYISLWWIITGKIGLGGLSGPIGLTGVVSTVVGEKIGFSIKLITLINLAALISANLGVVNALPIPGLDGSHILFIGVELIRGGRKISPRTQAIISYAGLGLMILLAVVIAGNDIVRLIRGG